MARWPPHLYLKEAGRRGIGKKHARYALREAHRLQDKGLAAVLSLNHLARMVGVEREYLYRVVGRLPDTQPYQSFNMKKRRMAGGYRRIHAPHPALRRTQRWIVDNILARVQPHATAFAYKRGLKNPIVSCAKVHCGAAWLVKMDVERFFESISEPTVYQIFRLLGYRPLVSFELARLSTWPYEPNATGGKYPVPQQKLRYQEGSCWVRDTPSQNPYGGCLIGSLPQGAPTSPMLANLHCKAMDAQMEAVAAEVGFAYSRYSDDFTFSSRASSRGQVKELVRTATRVLASSGLRENVSKTKISPPGSRKVVLGLLVDGDRPRLTRARRSAIRQHLYSISRDPVIHAAARGFSSVWALIRHVRGLVEFASTVDETAAVRYREQLDIALLKHDLLGQK